MFRSAAVLALAVALSGCSSVEASTPTAGTATPNLPCTLPYGIRVVLLSPVPGSTGVGTGSLPFTLIASRPLPKTVTMIATDTTGAAGTGAALERLAATAHPAPSPFSHPVYYRASGITLQAHRHYTVALDDLAQNGCAPYAPLAGEARFST
jgi:hypothetical protein